VPSGTKAKAASSTEDVPRRRSDEIKFFIFCLTSAVRYRWLAEMVNRKEWE
jgi:hypothetical protein